MSTALDYAAPGALTERRRFTPIRIALLCWVIPLGVGVTTFLLWLLTEAGALMAIGFVTLLAGALLAFVGSVMLVVHVVGRFEDPRPPMRRRIAQAFVVALLLLANFPIAYGIVQAVESINSSYHVTVVNAGTATIDSFVVTGPSFTTELGPVAPGKRKRVRLAPRGDGSITFAARRAGMTRSGTIDPYVSGPMTGGDHVVTLTDTAESVRAVSR